MFYDNYVRLCRKVGKSPTAAAADCGISGGTVSKWKRGAIPFDSTLHALADYFGVTVEDLLRDDEKPTTSEGDGLDRAILAFLHRLPAERLRGILIALEAPEELLAMLDHEEPRG